MASTPLAALFYPQSQSAGAKTRSEDAARVERGGSLLQIAQLQTTTSLSTMQTRIGGREPRTPHPLKSGEGLSQRALPLA